MQVLCHRPCANNYRENRKTHHHLPWHGKIHGLDYCTSLFVSCRQPCHGEIHGVDYRTSLFVSCHRSCCSTGYDQRRNTTNEERIVQVKKGLWDAWAKRGEAMKRERKCQKETCPVHRATKARDSVAKKTELVSYSCCSLAAYVTKQLA